MGFLFFLFFLFTNTANRLWPETKDGIHLFGYNEPLNNNKIIILIIIHQSICDHVVNKMFIGCKDMAKYCSSYSLLWQSASRFVISYNNNDKRDFKMDSNKTVNNVLDKRSCLFPFVCCLGALLIAVTALKNNILEPNLLL